ncbi:hypothetical protein GJ744_001386 [Endocarpon pusillum]|uniref:Uncharacterized protein n=1 Tax=Endocarpon pusillum TaxID=364733 RepID=A0A8H7ASY6_9EURO|nr:hypothetical protein GJ744_001386 [Endocarpon pusillum]
MGNLCSKSANKPDAFPGQGRVVGTSSSQPASSAPIPQKITSNSPGRPLGGSSVNSGGSFDGAASDPRSAAAKAAEERAKAASRGTSGGKLSAQLEAQKKQTRSELLAAGSKEEQQARAADAAAEARNYN